MESLLSIVTVWLSVNFGLPATGPSPEITFVPKETISTLWIEKVEERHGAEVSLFERDPQHHAIEAFYDDQRRIIVLADDWNPESPQDVSVLVHEMVHHLQNLDGRTYPCHAEREKLSYDAQGAWLALFGTSLEASFEIDPMTLLLRTKCM